MSVHLIINSKVLFYGLADFDVFNVFIFVQSDAKSIENTEEYMEMYKMPDWLTSMLPQKSPYVPQVGDEVM